MTVGSVCVPWGSNVFPTRSALAGDRELVSRNSCWKNGPRNLALRGNPAKVLFKPFYIRPEATPLHGETQSYEFLWWAGKAVGHSFRHRLSSWPPGHTPGQRVRKGFRFVLSRMPPCPHPVLPHSLHDSTQLYHLLEFDPASQ